MLATGKENSNPWKYEGSQMSETGALESVCNTGFVITE